MLSKEIQDFYEEQFPAVAPVDVTAELPVHPTKKYKLRAISNIKRIVVHTTDWIVTPKRLAEYDIAPFEMHKGKKIYNHISKTGCPAITYHEMFTEDGHVYTTLPYEQISWHAGAWNPGSLAVAMVSRVSDKDGKDVYAPPGKLLKTTQTRVGQLCLGLGLPPERVVGHRELKGTGWFLFKGSRRLRKTCPGRLVDLDLLRVNVAKYMQIRMKIHGEYKGEIDGDFGPKSRNALAYWGA